MLVDLACGLVQSGQTVKLGPDRVGREHVVSSDGRSDLSEGSPDLPEIEPRGIDKLAGHEGQGSSAVEVTVVVGREAGVEVVTDRAVNIDEVVPADRGVAEE